MDTIKSYKDFRIFVLKDIAQRNINFAPRLLINSVICVQVALRLYELLINRKSVWRFLFKMYFNRLLIRLGFSIPPNVFDYSLCIVHYGNLVVNPNAKIGRNYRIHVGVNIGSKTGFYKPNIAKNIMPNYR